MSDLFSQITEIKNRLIAEVADVSVYYGSQIISANWESTGMPSILIVPGEAVLLGDVPARLTGATERKQWLVGVRMAIDTSASEPVTVEHQAGRVAHSVINALHGYKFTTVSKTSPLRYQARDALIYVPESGYSELWLKFDADMAIA